jgi:O-antigen/teichoic acid export membrane protein
LQLKFIPQKVLLMSKETPRSILSTGFLMLLMQAIGLAVSFMLAVVLARGLGPTEFGKYSFALSVALLLAVPVQLGLPTLVVRDTARLNQANETRQLYRLWSWTTQAVLLISGAIALIVLLLAPLIVDPSITLSLLLIVLALVPLLSIGALRAAALRGLGHVIQGQLPEVLLRPGLLLILVLVASVFSSSGGMQAQGALLLNLAATALAFLVGLALLHRVAPPVESGAKAQSFHRIWIRTGMVLGVASSAIVVNRNLDMMMLGSLRPVSEVGIYKIAVTLAMLSATTLNILDLAVQPRIAQMYVVNDIARMQRLVTFISRLGFAAGCFVALIFLLLGEWLIGTAFGAEYSTAYGAMLILVAGQMTNTFFGPVMMVLNMSGQERLVMYGVLVAAAGNLVLNAILIPCFGIIGAAIATALTLFSWKVLLHIAAMRKLGIDCSVFGLHRKGNLG